MNDTQLLRRFIRAAYRALEAGASESEISLEIADAHKGVRDSDRPRQHASGITYVRHLARLASHVCGDAALCEQIAAEELFGSARLDLVLGLESLAERLEEGNEVARRAGL